MKIAHLTGELTSTRVQAMDAKALYPSWVVDGN